MTSPLDHSTRYDLMSTNQASPSEMAEWLKEPGFAAYVAERQGKQNPIIEGMQEALAVAKGAQPAARIWIKGHAYVPEATIPAAEPVAEQWCAIEGGVPRTAWRDPALGDRPGWEALAARAPDKYAVEKRALYASPQPALPVVKPLEWVEWEDGATCFVAKSPVGEYSVVGSTDIGTRVLPANWWRGGGKSNETASLDAAKAAAQADYEQRIRSALVAPQPARPEAPFEFDRYVNGQLMAEGVTIERETTLEAAIVAAARIASRGPNGETPVLVYRARPASPQPARETGLEAAAKWHDGEADKALDRLQTAVDRKKRLWLADANRMHRKSAAALRARCQP